MDQARSRWKAFLQWSRRPRADAVTPASPPMSTPAVHALLPQVAFAIASLVMALVVVFVLRDWMGAFVLGAVIAFLINPWVDWLEERRVPRALAILVVYAGLISIIAGIIGLFIPLVAHEVSRFVHQLPTIVAGAQQRINQLRGNHNVRIMGYPLDPNALVPAPQEAGSSSQAFLLGKVPDAFQFTISVVGTALQVLLMLIVAFLLSLDSRRILRFSRSLVPNPYRNDFDVVWARIRTMLRSYVRGQLVIAATIGVMAWLADLMLVGVDYALALGVLAFLTALVPYLGPFLGAIPAILVALSRDPTKALLVAIAYFVISNLVLNFLYPKVVGDAVNLPPLVVIIAFIAGFSVGGILGMFVAVPLAAIFRILFDHLRPRIYGTAG